MIKPTNAQRRIFFFKRVAFNNRASNVVVKKMTKNVMNTFTGDKRYELGVSDRNQGTIQLISMINTAISVISRQALNFLLLDLLIELSDIISLQNQLFSELNVLNGR